MPFFFGAGFFAGAAVVGLADAAVELAAGLTVAAVLVAGTASVAVDEFVTGAAAGVSTIGVTSIEGFGIGLATTEEI